MVILISMHLYVLTLILCACMCVKEVDHIERRTDLNMVFLTSYWHKEKFAKCGIEPRTSGLWVCCCHVGCYEGIIIKNTYHHFTKVRTSKAIILEASGPLDKSSDDCCSTKSTYCLAVVTVISCHTYITYCLTGSNVELLYCCWQYVT